MRLPLRMRHKGLGQKMKGSIQNLGPFEHSIDARIAKHYSEMVLTTSSLPSLGQLVRDFVSKTGARKTLIGNRVTVLSKAGAFGKRNLSPPKMITRKKITSINVFIEKSLQKRITFQSIDELRRSLPAGLVVSKQVLSRILDAFFKKNKKVQPKQLFTSLPSIKRFSAKK